MLRLEVTADKGYADGTFAPHAHPPLVAPKRRLRPGADAAVVRRETRGSSWQVIERLARGRRLRRHTRRSSRRSALESAARSCRGGRACGTPHQRRFGLQDQHAALRRVTRLITRHAELEAVFDTVVSEVARVLDASAWLLRDDWDGRTSVLASVGDSAFPKGSRWPREGSSLLGSSLTSPVVVDGVTWGVLCARPKSSSRADAEACVEEFAELVSVAVADASARAALRRLAGEQAALRHVATLVAEGSSPSDLFAAVARAVAQAIDVDAISVERIDADRSTTVIASLDAPMFPIGSRWPLDEPGLHASVIASGRPVRIDDVSGLDGRAGTAVRTRPSGRWSLRRSSSTGRCGD